MVISVNTTANEIKIVIANYRLLMKSLQNTLFQQDKSRPQQLPILKYLKHRDKVHKLPKFKQNWEDKR